MITTYYHKGRWENKVEERSSHNSISKKIVHIGLRVLTNNQIGIVNFRLSLLKNKKSCGQLEKNNKLIIITLKQMLSGCAIVYVCKGVHY